GGVPCGDFAFEIGADNRHGRGIDERAELFIATAGGGFAGGSNELHDVVSGDEENDSGSGRGGSGNELHRCREPIDGPPDSKHFHKVSGPAADNKNAEGPKEI